MLFILRVLYLDIFSLLTMKLLHEFRIINLLRDTVKPLKHTKELYDVLYNNSHLCVLKDNLKKINIYLFARMIV